jgi:hypothetical protein
VQPLVTPAWICVVVGTGVANSVPGAVRVAAAAIEPPGTVPRWQLSQDVDDGMCDVGPAGLVGGITTICGTPAKLVPVMDGPWQATQLLVMPAWFISEPLNFAPSTTGVAEMLEPGPTWQVSHEAVVGRWLDGSPTMEKLAAGMAKPGAAEPWHCAQLPLVLGAFAWIAVSVGMTEKSAST